MAALLKPSAPYAQTNRLIPVGTGSVTARGLNNSGQILVDSGVITNGVLTPFPLGFSGASINAQGDVAGKTAAGNIAILHGSTVTDLAVPGQPQINVAGSNASGEVVGAWQHPVYVGFLYSGGSLTDLAPILETGDEGSSANGINDLGQVAGCNDVSSISRPLALHEAWVLDSGMVTDLGPGCAVAINATGTLAGFTSDKGDGRPHAALFDHGAAITLVEPPPYASSQASAINATGQMVGTIAKNDTAQGDGFYYNGALTPISAMINPTDPLRAGLTQISPVAINDQRVILLNALDSIGQPHAYLLQAPWLDVTPGPLSFPAQALGTTSNAQVLTLTNGGTAPLSIDSVSSTAEFPVSNACPTTLAAGAQCSVSIIFAPVSMAGDRVSAIGIASNGVTLTAPVSGSVAIETDLTATPAQPTAGMSFTIAWESSPGSMCASSGGAPGDGWAAQDPMQPLGATGSAAVTESAAGSYTYLMTCSDGSQSKQSVLTLAVSVPASGGGGTLEMWLVLALGSALGWRLLTVPRAAA